MLYLVFCIIRSRFRTSITPATLQVTHDQELSTISTDLPESSFIDKSLTSITPLHVLPASSTSVHESGPPSLGYSLYDRKLAITLFWSLVVLDSVILPITLYFVLWYYVDRDRLSASDVFSVVTAAVGGVGVVEYFWRFWKLIRNNSQCRPIGAGRLYADVAHWTFTVMWGTVLIELVTGTCLPTLPIRLVAMPLPSVCFAIGIPILFLDILRVLHFTLPFRISSLSPRQPLRPGIYPFIEDIVAVDGGGGTAYRQRFETRYDASWRFRRLLSRLSLFWGAGAVGTGGVTTALVFTLEREVAYAVGWSLPFLLAGIGVGLTIWYSKKELARETLEWQLARM